MGLSVSPKSPHNAYTGYDVILCCMKSSGTADLPLHGGKTPRWLFDRMVTLSGSISRVVIDEFGVDEFLRRIANPYWFQAFSCTIGFDWHSSGTTTTTCGALKVALDPVEHGIAVAGGKGKASRKTPDEIKKMDSVFSIKPSRLDKMTYASKMSAKVDNSCVQDDYHLYHHSFFVTEKGDWSVVQQGMKGAEGYARRYHWLSENMDDYIEEPHEALCCDNKESRVLDMTSRTSEESRNVSVDLIKDDPDHLRRYLDKRNQSTLTDFADRNLELPSHHPVIDIDISDRGWKVLKKAYELQPDNYEDLVSLKGMGPKKIRALAMVSDLVYGAESSWEDPVKYSFTHGGKDGTPFPVDREVYDNTIDTLKETVAKTEVDKKDKKYALKRLKDYINKESD